MNDANCWPVAVLGCGAANYAVVKALTSDPAVMPQIARLDTVDWNTVRDVNTMTCPQYRGHVGQSKADCLKDFADKWARRAIFGRAWHQPVETIPWQQLLPAGAKRCRGLVLVGLDDWSARLVVLSDLRIWAHTVRSGIVVVQTALEHREASINVFTTQWSDPCPACGIWSLPGSVPCVVAGGAVRGHLRVEADAAAEQVAVIVRDVFAGKAWKWSNRRVAIRATGARFQSFVRVRQLAPGCWGPHGPAVPLGPEAFRDEGA